MKSGGHNIETTVIERRYKSGIKNLFELYEPIVDTFCLYDNTKLLEPIAVRSIDSEEIKIINHEKFKVIKDYYEKIR